MDIIPDKKDLLGLVQQASKGTIALPMFQRNFIWSRDDVTDLLRSVLKNYFIGSFLLLRIDPDDSPFAYRSIAGIDRDSIRPDWLILDGQQRLTSLHYVFTAPPLSLKWTKYPYRFFLDLKKLDESDLDDAIFSERSDSCAELLVDEIQFERQIVPFTELRRWEDWLNRYEKWLIGRDKDQYFEQYFPNWKPRWNEVVGVLKQFLVPTIEIPKIGSGEVDRIAEVCAIFEKMNSTGVALSVYDLLTARIYPHGIDLHRLWEETCKEHDCIQKFAGRDCDPDPYALFMLRTVALMRGREVKGRSLINLSAENFESDWKRADRAMEKALQRIEATNADGFGVFDQKWLPYSTIVPVLAALLDRIERDGNDARALAGLKAWYWASVFLERYAGSVESITFKDYRDLVQWFQDPSYRPEVFEQATRNIVQNPNFQLRSTTRRNAVYRGIMNLIAIRGAKDFQADDAIEFHVLDDHHIFPKAFLSKRHPQAGPVEVNTVVNKTLISALTNRRISRKAPSEYIVELLPAAHRDQILASHFIEDDALEALLSDDYDWFLRARERTLVNRVREVVAPPEDVRGVS